MIKEEKRQRYAEVSLKHFKQSELATTIKISLALMTSFALGDMIDTSPRLMPTTLIP